MTVGITRLAQKSPSLLTAGMRVAITSTKRELDTVLLQQIDAAYTFARWALGHPVIAESVIADLMVSSHDTQAAHRASARARVLREVWLAAQRQPECNAAQSFADLVVPARVASNIGARAAGIELQPAAVDSLRRAVAGLALEQREVVLLRDTEGMSYRETAALLGLPRSTMVSRLRQARDALESALEDSRELTPDHDEAPALIDAYIDADVDIDTAAAFVQHIARCRVCAQRLLNRSRLVQHIRNVTMCRAPASLRKQIQQRLSEMPGT
jgi:DNA-directed RNA polymerase specialized sigma24 family protein